MFSIDSNRRGGVERAFNPEVVKGGRGSTPAVVGEGGTVNNTRSGWEKSVGS